MQVVRNDRDAGVYGLDTGGSAEAIEEVLAKLRQSMKEMMDTHWLSFPVIRNPYQVECFGPKMILKCTDAV